ncbi:MAG: class I SAM-dependent methyltransferase [Acidimicrobiia bacterium]
MPDLFGSPAMAAGYARARPAVHPHVLELARARLGLTAPVARALDVGCGAGLSTVPLQTLARSCLGIDPVETMVRASPFRSDRVAFAAARAEALPVCSGSVDLITAAGSLNFVDLEPFFSEAVRVLRPPGALVVYDFSAGRRFGSSAELDDWFTEFERRYPRATGVARPLDPESLAVVATGFRLAGSERFSLGLPLAPDFYLDYVMTETNVAHAVQGGEDPEAIRSWCSRTLADVFAGAAREVLFDGYLAHLAPT